MSFSHVSLFVIGLRLRGSLFPPAQVFRYPFRLCIHLCFNQCVSKWKKKKIFVVVLFCTTKLFFVYLVNLTIASRQYLHNKIGKIEKDS